MRFISITKSINIRLDWANITGTVLKAGTPISLTGVVANTADAVGILSQDVSKSDAVVAVVTEGTIDLGEIAASYGELDDAAISAMHGITFINDGEPVAPSGGGGGGGGVTTLYFYHDSIYETSDFWTDPTMSDPSAVVPFADALAMVQANPASVLFQSSASGAMPAHAKTDGYGIYITMLAAPMQSGMMVYGYRFDATPDFNSETTIFLSVGS